MALSDYIYYTDTAGEIYQGDSLEVLKATPDCSVQCCVTSPPYWGLRDYGVDGQLGLEKTPEEYVAKMVEIFREVRRVLKADGTLWLNLGDSYAGSGRGRDADGTWNPGQGGSKQETNKGAIIGRQVNSKSLSKNLIENNAIGNAWVKPPRGYKAKDLIGIPWRVAFALQADGWYLRSDIIWNKPNPMPESVTDRPTKSHEYIFLMSKSARYYYDADAIKETAETLPNDKSHHAFGVAGGKVDSCPKRKRESGKKWNPSMGGGGTGFDGHSGNSKADGTTYITRNKRSVWTIATQPYKAAHFATFPPDLIKPCVLAGSRAGDVVLDPFIGSGTTAMVAKELGRRFIGIDLNAEYIKLIMPRIAQEVLF